MTRYQTWLALGSPDIYCLWVDEMLHEWAKEVGEPIAAFRGEVKSYRGWYRWRLCQADGQEVFDAWLADRYPSRPSRRTRVGVG